MAHAWFNDADSVIDEGRCEALADCIQELRGTPWVPGGVEVRMWEHAPDLRVWQALAPDQTDQNRIVGYFIARRAFRVARSVLPSTVLWSSPMQTWSDFVRLVGEAGPDAAPLYRAVSGTPGDLAAALADHDMDERTAVEEALAKTDESRWDSDGDGWWDGAQRPAIQHAIPLSRTGPICLPWVSPGEETVVVYGRGRKVGTPDPTPNPNRGLLFHTPSKTVPGGFWVAPIDAAAVENPACGYTSAATVLAARLDTPGVAQALAEAATAALTKLPHVGHRLVVLAKERRRFVEAGTSTVGEPLVTIPDDIIDHNPVQLGNVAAAVHVVSRSRARPAGSALALAIAMDVLDVGGLAPVEAVPSEARPWMKLAKSCATGWAGVLDLTCR